MEGFIAAFGNSPWGPLALAFLFGVAFGWLVWGMRPKSREDSATDSPMAQEPKEIVVLRAELQAARALLEQVDDKDEVISSHLSTLDEAVKRANGRLKATLAGIKRAAGGD